MPRRPAINQEKPMNAIFHLDLEEAARTCLLSNSASGFPSHRPKLSGIPERRRLHINRIFRADHRRRLRRTLRRSAREDRQGTRLVNASFLRIPEEFEG